VKSDNQEKIIGSDAVAVESLVVTLVSVFVFGLGTEWSYFWLFQFALGLVILAMLLRVMANRATDPDIGKIKRSVRWSAKLLQVALIGAIAAISLYIEGVVQILQPVILFAGLSIALSLFFILLDELILGEYIDTWRKIIYQHTGDNAVGRLLRSTADYCRDTIEAAMDEESSHRPANTFKGLALITVLASLFLLVSLPVGILLTELFNDFGTAILVIFSIVLHRDLTRYIYINYGAAVSFEELKWGLKWEFVWIIFISGLVAGVLGYIPESVLSL